MANTRYAVPTGTGNFSSTTMWSATSGGAGGASGPVAGDTIIMDANSGTGTYVVDVNTSCATFDASAFTGTLTVNSYITAINFTLGSGMTMTGTGGTISLAGGAPFSINTNGCTITCRLLFNGATVNLGSNINVNGDLVSVGSTIFHNSYNFTVGGNVTASSDLAVNYPTDSVGITMTGASAVWSGSGRMGCNINYNNAAGNLTLSGTVNIYQGGSLTVTAANSVITTGSTLTVVGLSTYINAPGLTLNNLTLNGTSATCAINSSGVSINGTLTFNTGTCTLAGTNGLTINNFTINGNNNKLTAGLTYIVNGLLTSIGTSGTHTAIASTTTTKAILTLNGTQNMQYCNGSYIDSSGGKTINSKHGVLSNTINWTNTAGNGLLNFFMHKYKM